MALCCKGQFGLSFREFFLFLFVLAHRTKTTVTVKITDNQIFIRLQKMTLPKYGQFFPQRHYKLLDNVKEVSKRYLFPRLTFVKKQLYIPRSLFENKQKPFSNFYQNLKISIGEAYTLRRNDGARKRWCRVLPRISPKAL
ncbi:hypothetical protein L873DRAFT_463345 [Choiromyces venosus 120613-1]|uniref:Secreted protein n=1 Tax=Choiromyces venosus 120613-1 TaxID=1336337 RepID=A0A3N4JVS5_9PEZI|nr:hypothetical protein L873DRAFT_463345 [Choiromyces venosus 120613-1]